MVPVFKNVGERSRTKNYHPVSFPSAARKVFEKLVNNRLKIINSTITSIITSTLKCDFSSDFQQRFRSSRSTTDLLTVTPDRTARAFNRNRATRAVALNNSKTFGKARHAGHLHKQVL